MCDLNNLKDELLAMVGRKPTNDEVDLNEFAARWDVHNDNLNKQHASKHQNLEQIDGNDISPEKSAEEIEAENQRLKDEMVQRIEERRNQAIWMYCGFALDYNNVGPIPSKPYEQIKAGFNESWAEHRKLARYSNGKLIYKENTPLYIKETPQTPTIPESLTICVPSTGDSPSSDNEYLDKYIYNEDGLLMTLYGDIGENRTEFRYSQDGLITGLDCYCNLKDRIAYGTLAEITCANNKITKMEIQNLISVEDKSYENLGEPFTLTF